MAKPERLPDDLTASPDFLREELESALRNREMPLEALRHDVTPTGLHYLLCHYDIPGIDPHAWRIVLDGAVERPRSMTVDELAALPRVSLPVTLECAGNGRAFLDPRPIGQPWLIGGVSTAEWGGTPLWSLLQSAGIRPEATNVAFYGADAAMADGDAQPYARSLTLADCRDGPILADTMNGLPLQPQHGAPLRLVVPGWYGMASVKWLTRIEVRVAPFDGEFQGNDYMLVTSTDGDRGEAVTRILPRALMVPPGMPDAASGDRRLAGGLARLEGRAWSGSGPITKVEVTVDGGATWTGAQVEPSSGEHAWSRWTFSWNAVPGRHRLAARASDGVGNQQPIEPRWNRWGYANNGVSWVTVRVD